MNGVGTAEESVKQSVKDARMSANSVAARVKEGQGREGSLRNY